MKGRILLIFAATLCIGAAAQTTVLDLTLDRAIEIALAENPTIKIADMVIQRYDYVRDGYIANLLPSASASGSYSRNVISQKLGGSISIQGKNTITAGATVGMPLFAPGVYASLRLTREQMVGAVEAARGSKLSLVNEVKKAFYNALLAQNSLEVLHSAESNIKEVVNNVRTLYNNGLAAEYDLISAEVQQSNLHPTIIQTENAIDISKMLLKMYLCLPENVNITLRGDLNDYIGRAKSSNSVFITDVDENSMLRSLDIQSRVLTQQLRVMRTQRMPVVAAFGNIQFMGQDFNLSGFLPGTGDSESSKYKYNWQHPAAVGVQVSVPIFAGGGNTARERALRNNIEQLNLQRNYAEEGLQVQAVNTINSIIAANERMSATQNTIVQAQKAYDISTVRYNAGAGTMLELNSSQLSLTQAQLNHTQSIYDYLSALADYEQIIGKE